MSGIILIASVEGNRDLHVEVDSLTILLSSWRVLAPSANNAIIKKLRREKESVIGPPLFATM